MLSIFNEASESIFLKLVVFIFLSFSVGFVNLIAINIK